VRRTALLVLSIPVLVLSSIRPAAADDPLQITALSAVPTTVDLPTGQDGQVDFSATTSGTNPAGSVSVSVAGQTAPLSTSDNTSWSGPVTIPAGTKAGSYGATATALNGSEQAQADLATDIVVRTEPVISLAFTPTVPRAGGSYTVYGSIREPDGAGGLTGMPATLTLQGPGYASTFAVSSSGAFHHAVSKALPATWSVSFAASGNHLATSTTASLTSVSANPTRIVSFDAGPEPAYFNGAIGVRGYLQRYSPTLGRWVAYGGQLVTISRYSPTGFVTHRTTTSTGYFAALIRGYAVESAAWHASYSGYRVGSTLVNAPTTSSGDAVATTFAPLRITRVYYDSPGSDFPVTNGKLNAEYIRITNMGSRTANLFRWVVYDAVGHYYEFSTLYLSPGHSVYLHTGKGTNSGANVYWNQGYYVWNNDGDTAKLTRYYDNHLVDTCSWGSTGSGYTNC
jgi:hypothetical protein